MDFVVKPKEIIHNPDPKDLRSMVADMPNAKPTEYGNYNVETHVTARSKGSTYIATDTPEEHTDQSIPRSKLAAMAKLQDDYIRSQTMLVIDGFIGPDPATRTPVRMFMEKRNANISAMQQQLYFTPASNEWSHFEPQLRVVYTPNLPAEGFPNDRLIAVDLQNNITRVFHSDYFGESKKGGLRMWNKLIYNRGGLSMHAGCKVIPVGGSLKTCLIVGLSGTGKTTTTFTRQNGSRPVQDDFIALMPDGRVLGTENGCFAKTFGLDPNNEPMIHGAVTKPQAYLENVSQNGTGKIDFFDDSYTRNGRATFPFSLIDEAGDVRNIPPVDFVLILNRNDNIIPAVARLTKEQAAAYFMLGETQGTSAGGAEEAGKALRVPGTNPFFPLRHGLQGTRFLELARKLPKLEVYLMNTGWVGGHEGTQNARKVKIRHSSAVVKAVAEGTIRWRRDEDFGYEVAESIPDFPQGDDALLHPKSYYDDLGQHELYRRFVDRYKTERVAHLKTYPSVTDELVNAVA